MDCWKICEKIKKTLPQNVRLPSCELYNTCNLYAWLRKSTYSVGNCIQYVLQVAYNCIQYVLQVTYNFIKHTLRVIRLILILTLIYIVWSGFSSLFLIYPIACNETTVVGNGTQTILDYHRQVYNVTFLHWKLHYYCCGKRYALPEPNKSRSVYSCLFFNVDLYCQW